MIDRLTYLLHLWLTAFLVGCVAFALGFLSAHTAAKINAMNLPVGCLYLRYGLVLCQYDDVQRKHKDRL